ncbi:MAG: hypothetical protein ACR2PM_14210 [Hyphomicrobiales bacterium]
MGINRWFILGVLFIARFALGFQFQPVGSPTPFIVRDFGIDHTGIGTLVGLYMIPGVFLSVPSGFIGKRLGGEFGAVWRRNDDWTVFPAGLFRLAQARYPAPACSAGT